MPSVRLAINSGRLYFVTKYFVLVIGVIFIYFTGRHLLTVFLENSDNKYTDHFTVIFGPQPNVKILDYHAAELSQRLITFFTTEGAKSVIDFGGGNSHLVQNLVRNGIFASCYIGSPSPHAQDVSNGICGTLDLTQPVNLAQYDWVLSLSVGRQIPPKYEHDFISNIDKLNKKGVVIYWGNKTPGEDKSVRDNMIKSLKII